LEEKVTLIERLKMSDAHSSISKGPLVLKILIDKKEYESLLRAKAFQDKYQNKLKEDYILKPQNDEEEKRDEEEKGKVSAGQIGEGSAETSDLKTLISEIVKKEVSERLNLSEKQQIGSGENSDLAEELARPAENPNHEPPSAVEETIKSSQNSIGVQELLLNKIPSKFKQKAEKLLEVFEQVPNSITWNSDGVIFINQDSLPNSNIFILLPELFKKNPNKKLPGFYEFTSEIATLGYGHLIEKGVLRGLQRSAPIERQNELYEGIKTENWWYIG
jgi:hypothetical protein